MRIRLAQAGAMAKAYPTARYRSSSTRRTRYRPGLAGARHTRKSKRFARRARGGAYHRGRALGLLLADNKYRRTPLPVDELHLLPIFALHLATAVDNTRMFTEHEASRRELAESVEQQTATSEITQVISSSPTDLQPAVDAIAESAARLCDARDALIFRVRGASQLRRSMGSALVPEEAIPLTRDMASGRAVVDRSIVHVPDLHAESDAHKEIGRRLGVRTLLVTPAPWGQSDWHEYYSPLRGPRVLRQADRTTSPKPSPTRP